MGLSQKGCAKRALLKRGCQASGDRTIVDRPLFNRRAEALSHMGCPGWFLAFQAAAEDDARSVASSPFDVTAGESKYVDRMEPVLDSTVTKRGWKPGRVVSRIPPRSGFFLPKWQAAQDMLRLAFSKRGPPRA